MSDDNKVSVQTSGPGCLGCVGFLIVVWALLFGLTIGEYHYSVSCSTERGVELQAREVR